jgi:tRNA threonylcarbamoyladenosine biosynthesis protein TsaB
MTVVLGLDTATPSTAIAVVAPGADPQELRHDPAPGERPQHASRLLPLAREALAAAGLGFGDVDRIGVGIGPGTFTGLRIGVATARALAQASAAELAAVSSLHALADAAADEAGGGPVLAVIDARRGEAFAESWRDAARLGGPLAARPEALAALAEPAAGAWLAVGDGAVRFRLHLEPAATVPADGSHLHRVSALAICRLALGGPTVPRDALLPEYVRAPDAAEQPRGAGGTRIP